MCQNNAGSTQSIKLPLANIDWRLYSTITVSIQFYFNFDLMQAPTLIIHIDNNPENLLLFRQSLEAVSLEAHLHEISTAGDAVKIMAQVLPDLVVVNYNMPGINGPEFIRTIRANNKFNATKIILLTSATEAGSTPLQHGADRAYIKPSSIEKFKPILEELLRDE